MPSGTTFHSTTRRLASGVGKVHLDHIHRPLSTRFPSITERKSRFERRHWMGETLCTLSTAMGLTGLRGYERELLESAQWGGRPGGGGTRYLRNVLSHE